MATPVLRALGARFPDAEIDVLCSKLAKPLLETWPGIGALHSLRYRNLPSVLSPEKQRLVRQLRSRRYRFAVLLEQAPRYRALLKRAGIEDIRSFRETPFDPKKHAIVNNLRAASLDEREVSLDMNVFLAADDRLRASALLQHIPVPRVGIHIGYGPRGRKRKQSERLKGWPLERFGEVCRRVAGRGAGLVFTGSKEDRADVASVASMLPNGVPMANLAGQTTVRELAAVIERLDVFVSVDSGPAHLAAALEVPLVVLWGPAIVDQVRPLSSKSPVLLLRHAPPCAPCYETPLMRTCRRNVCMEAITPEEVAAATETLLAR